MKRSLRRFLSIFLCICMLCALVPGITPDAYAATSGKVTGLSDASIGLSFSGDAEDAWTAKMTSVSGSVVSTEGACEDTHYSSTLTITNNKSVAATLSFDYSIALNGGSAQIAGSDVTANSSYTGSLAAGESIKVYIKSASATATTITLSNIALVSDVTATATFTPAQNGSYTVDSKAITADYSNTQSSLTAYKLVATPASGYQFMGWYNVTSGKFVSLEKSASLNIESDCTITAKFVSAEAAVFYTGSQVFTDLNEAVSYAQANKLSMITLIADGSISGSYTIPAGITLLIPFDEAATVYTDSPGIIRTTPASKPFRTLTLAEGASITVNGSISIGGKYFAAAGGQQGRCVGDYGYIKMASGSSITVKNGGNLYAWGFISGSGSVLAESGATVYEFFQIADFRGGSASSQMKNGVFPFSQYFVQNIEVPVTFNAGATEKVYSGVYALNATNTTGINFIGNDGMFKVVSGSFTKDYDEQTDHLVFTVNGEAELNTLSLSLAGVNVNSAEYVLPITNNISINIQSGKVTVNQDTALLPGVKVNIANGADLTVASGKNVYVYDSSDWGNYVWGNCKFKSVAYAPGKAYNRSDNDLSDVKLNVNGTLTAIGAIYTTQGGADICSDGGTGVFVQQGAPGTKTETYQYDSNSTKFTIGITAAKLHNPDGTYVETAGAKAGDTIAFASGEWGGEPAKEVKITYNANGGKGSMSAQTTVENTELTLNANTFTRQDYDFAGWNTAADGSGTAYADKAQISVSADTVLYAQWTLHKYTVKWVNYDGTVLYEGKYTCEDAENGNCFFDANYPVKPEDDNYTYKFRGWNPADGDAPMELHKDTTFTAQFNQFKKLTVSFNAGGGEGAMASVKIANGSSSTYYTLPECGFTREGYSFDGWLVTGMVGYNAFDKFELNNEKWTDAKLLAFSDLTLTASWKCDHHSTELRNAKEATPTEKGYTGDTYCTVCGELVSKGSEIPYTSGWTENDGGKQFFVDGVAQKTGWTEIDGKTYYLDTETGYAATGICKLALEGSSVEARCVFDANGVFMKDKTGLYNDGENTYWINCGVIEEEAGLKRVVTENGEVNYYYFAVQENLDERSDLTLSAAVTDAVLDGDDCWIHKTNGLLLPEWGYCFDANGVIKHDADTSKNGIVNENGTLYYYVDGIKAPAGMIEVDGSYYYANSKGMLITGRTYYCSRTNSLMAEGTYAFDSDGKLIRGATDKNGIVTDSDGVLRYYVNGQVTYVGLIQIDGDYYYVRKTGELAVNCVYRISWTHGLMDPGPYRFDENGKLTGKAKHGIVEEDGVLHYYQNDKLTYAGLIKIASDYYYINSKCEAVRDCDYFITWTNDLMPQGRYHFDENGKLTGAVAPLKNGIYEEDGSLYYYSNGERTYAGLIKIGDDYYYVKSTCEVVHDCDYFITWTNDLMPQGRYHFDENGKLTGAVAPLKNGIYEEDGSLYFYRNGERTYAGLIQIDGSYYYVKSTCEVVHDCTYYVYWTNDLMPAGNYEFDSNGRMILEG